MRVAVLCACIMALVAIGRYTVCACVRACARACVCACVYVYISILHVFLVWILRLRHKNNDKQLLTSDVTLDSNSKMMRCAVTALPWIHDYE